MMVRFFIFSFFLAFLPSVSWACPGIIVNQNVERIIKHTYFVGLIEILENNKNESGDIESAKVRLLQSYLTGENLDKIITVQNDWSSSCSPEAPLKNRIYEIVITKYGDSLSYANTHEAYYAYRMKNLRKKIPVASALTEFIQNCENKLGKTIHQNRYYECKL